MRGPRLSGSREKKNVSRQSQGPEDPWTNHEMEHTLREWARRGFAQKLGPLGSPMVRNAERSVYNWAVQKTKDCNQDPAWENVAFRRHYKNKLNQLLRDLERGERAAVKMAVEGDFVKVTLVYVPQLVYRLQHKELETRNLAKYSADVLWPEGPWAKALLASREKELKKEQAQAQLDAEYTGMFKCRKCGKNKVTYTQAQTRSADEPMVRLLCFVLRVTAHLTLYPDDFLLLSRVREQVEGLSANDYSHEAAFQDDRHTLVSV
jgi:DNA-directed RNA polymerase subunit M/transcription elongation factor TFIIS